jgi:hypothetical protein
MLTDIEKKALALANEVRLERGLPSFEIFDRTFYSEVAIPNDLLAEALCRAIEQHEAFRQEVSDVVSELSSEYTSMGSYYADKLKRFILPKPDPLVEAWLEAFPGNHIDDAREECAKINAALAARGLTITETKE